MIVTAIIGIIAAVAVPLLLRSRLASNEASAIGSLKALCGAQVTFQNARVRDADGDAIGEFGSFSQLSNATPAFIDEVLGASKKSGYFFLVTTTGVANSDECFWQATAYPILRGLTGTRTFYIDQNGILRGKDVGGLPATRAMADPAAGGNFPPVSG